MYDSVVDASMSTSDVSSVLDNDYCMVYDSIVDASPSSSDISREFENDYCICMSRLSMLAYHPVMVAVS